MQTRHKNVEKKHFFMVNQIYHAKVGKNGCLFVIFPYIFKLMEGVRVNWKSEQGRRGATLNIKDVLFVFDDKDFFPIFVNY